MWKAEIKRCKKGEDERQQCISQSLTGSSKTTMAAHATPYRSAYKLDPLKSYGSQF